MRSENYDKMRMYSGNLVHITSMFLVRKTGDRPEVVPEGSTNFGLLGQFVEVPEDVVFTVEYSVRTAQMAVFKLLKLDKQPTPFPRVTHDIGVLWNAFRAMH